jgi:fructokinase
MSDFVAFGELLIDFTPAGREDGRPLFMQNPGGAPANVTVAMSNFGISSAFIGMVGDDQFGRFLKGVLEEKGVDTSGLVLSRDYNTTLAFVHLFENGDRDFTFYRKPGADIMFEPSMLSEELIAKARVFHTGSLSMSHEPSRSANLRAIEIAREAGVVISCDPNYRAPLWSGQAEAKTYMEKVMEHADIIKISDNEVEFLYGDIKLEDAARMLVDKGASMVFVTMGSRGAIYACANGLGIAQGYDVKAVDTTGAGDCFMGGVVSQFLGSGKTLGELTLDDVAGFARFANAAASLCVESRGGIPSMPYPDQVYRRLAQK